MTLAPATVPAPDDQAPPSAGDVGTVAVVHPRLSGAAAQAMVAAGFVRLARSHRREVWVRYPDPLTTSLMTESRKDQP